MTKGQLEAKISEIVSKFEVVYLGKGPKSIRTYILGDMIVIRMVSFLSHSDKKLASTPQGIGLYKEVQTHLFEEGQQVLSQMLKDSIAINIASTHMDISTKTGEKVIVLTLKEDLEEMIKNETSVSVFHS
ncbi:MAG: DUF2294 domain-containing protein [bacterium]|nr:DUF2294 domain-containing protein [bacterium]